MATIIAQMLAKGYRRSGNHFIKGSQKLSKSALYKEAKRLNVKAVKGPAKAGSKGATSVPKLGDAGSFAEASKQLKGMTKAQLKQIASDRNIRVPASAKKDDIVSSILRMAAPSRAGAFGPVNRTGPRKFPGRQPLPDLRNNKNLFEASDLGITKGQTISQVPANIRLRPLPGSTGNKFFQISTDVKVNGETIKAGDRILVSESGELLGKRRSFADMSVENFEKFENKLADDFKRGRIDADGNAIKPAKSRKSPKPRR